MIFIGNGAEFLLRPGDEPVKASLPKTLSERFSDQESYCGDAHLRFDTHRISAISSAHYDPAILILKNNLSARN